MVDCNAPEQMVPQVGPIAFPAVAPQGTQVQHIIIRRPGRDKLIFVSLFFERLQVI
jgi:hypothetical protein